MSEKNKKIVNRKQNNQINKLVKNVGGRLSQKGLDKL
jgi:hypothetical protein